jgi:hypothetical protein
MGPFGRCSETRRYNFRSRRAVAQTDPPRRVGPVSAYSAHDTDHNGALVLRDYLTERMVRRPAPRRVGRVKARA